MKKVCRKCNQEFEVEEEFKHQNYCRACFASLKENTRSPPRSLPNSGVGVALLDPSGTRIAPSLERVVRPSLREDGLVYRDCVREAQLILADFSSQRIEVPRVSDVLAVSRDLFIYRKQKA